MPSAGAMLCRGGILAAALLLAACSASPLKRFDAAEVPPLYIDDQVFTVDQALAAQATPDLLELNDEMRAFVEEFTGDVHTERSRLLALHTAIKSPAALHVQYDPFADGSAREVFRRGTANCLGYANLFVALAREAGLRADYQWMDIRPEWHRLGDRVAVRLHVNVLVRTRFNEDFMVDIDPLQRHEVAGSKLIDDREAEALYYGNQAMQRLSEGLTAEAWMGAVRALEIAPDLSHLWVNLGAIYRTAEQYDAAEQAYFRALASDRTDRSAMNNLVVLYGMQGREDEEAYWLENLHRYRLRNPYYHANLGDVAGVDGDWEAAFEHYETAVKLQPEDSELVYALGLVEFRRGNFDAATRWIEDAIEKANFEVDEQNYRIQLKAIKEQRAASL